MSRTIERTRTNGRSPKAATIVALLALAATLAGCATPDRLAATTASYAEDYRARHPISLTETPRSMDIFPAGGGLDKAGRLRVQTFAQDYARDGQGPIVIQIPSGRDGRHGMIVDQIRRELHNGGAQGYVQVGSYGPANALQAAPVRLSYVGLAASVAARCGEWPRDLASGSSVEGWENKSYWNYGCTTQSILARQVADPRDLVGPQGEAPSDVSMRTRAITKVRSGDDPSTKWQVRNSSIGNAGGG